MIQQSYRRINHPNASNDSQGIVCGLPQHQSPPDYRQLVYKSFQYPDQVGFKQLVNMTNILQQIRHEFMEDRVKYEPYKKQELDKRLLLLEQQIDSLMRYQFVVEDQCEGSEGRRTIKYGNLLIQKDNQIKELEKKIWYYENQYRSSDKRNKDLEEEIVRLHSIILEKNKMIDTLSGRSEECGCRDDSVDYLDTLIADLEKLKRSSRYISLSQVEGTLENWIFRLPNGSNLKNKLQYAEIKSANINKYRDFVVGKLEKVNQLYRSQIEELSATFRESGRIEYDKRILDALSLQGAQNDPILEVIFGGILDLGICLHDSNLAYSKVVEVPVQDARTKALIYKLAKEMKRLTEKYPKLYQQIDPRLAEFFSQPIIESIEVDQLDKLIEIVKIEPQVVKVDNVYAYNSQKNRKVEFYLRVLIKALLEEMEKMKMKTGILPEIDEGVIGMIRNEILDLVNVDDILKVYRTVPKIVEVQKVIEKVVEKIVEVPKFITAELREEIPVQFNKTEVVCDTIHVPVKEPIITPVVNEKLVCVEDIIERVIPVPEIHRYPVETIVERINQVQVEKIVPLIKEQPVTIEVPGCERIVHVPQTEIVEICKQKILETRCEIEKVKEVQVVIQKIVEVVKQIPKIVEVEKLVTKVIPQKQYVESEKIVNHVQEKYVPVQVYIEKIVPIVRVQERIVQVPQIIQKVVPCIEVRPEIIEIVRIQEKPVFQTKLKIIECTKEVPVVEIREVEKIVEKIVQVPIIHEKVIQHQNYIPQPFIETVEKTIHQAVQIKQPVILYEDRIVEVDKVINHCVEVPQIINIEKETLVPYQKVVDRVIPTPVVIEKIIQKIVEVPKVVQVEKIVEKIVPVPRICERVVEVEKIVEKIVKQTVFEEKIIEKEVRCEVPCIREKIIEIQKPVYVCQKREVPLQIVREVLVKDETVIVKPEIQTVEVQRLCIETRQVDVPMVIQKIITLTNTDHKFFELKQTEVIPVQIQCPVDIVKEKIIPVESIRNQIQVETAMFQKIVQVTVEPKPAILEVDRVVEKICIQKDIQVVQNRIPCYNDKIIEIEVPVEKIIQPIYYECQKIVEVPTHIEKIVEKIINIPKVYEIQKRVEVPIDRPKIIEIETIIPQLVTLNQSVEKIVQRIVEVPRLVQKLQVAQKLDEKVIPQERCSTRIEQVRTIQEKQVIVEELKVVENKIHLVNEVMKCVERLIEKPMNPEVICQEIVMEVPHIVEKIVERVVVMPQIVEVLKYVHQVIESEELIASSCLTVEDAQYSRISRSLNIQISKLRGMLLEIRGQSCEVRDQIAIIQSFMAEFTKFIIHPRIKEIIKQVPVEKVIEKERLVKLPVHSSEDAQRNLASAVLIDKLINQLRRIKKAYNINKLQLDQEILNIFGAQLDSPPSRYHGNDQNKILDEYVVAINNQFSAVGPWTPDHQKMLMTFIEDRFQLAFNLKKKQDQNKKLMMKNSNVVEQLKVLKLKNQSYENAYEPFKDIFGAIIQEGRRQHRIDQIMENKFKDIFESLGMLVHGYAMSLTAEKLEPLCDERFRSRLNQKQEEINKLKDRIRELMMGRGQCNLNHDHCGWDNGRCAIENDHTQCQKTIRKLQLEIRDYKIEIERLIIIERQHRECQSLIDSLKHQIYILRMEISKIRSPSKKDDTKPSTTPRQHDRHKDSSDGSSYGVNYRDYANLDENSKIDRGVYRSGNYEAGQRQSYDPHNYSSQYNTPHHIRTNNYDSLGSGAYSGQLGTSSKNGTINSSGYRVQATSRGSYQTGEYSKGTISYEHMQQMRQAHYEGSQGGSHIYSSGNRKIVRETKGQVGSSSRKY